MHPFIEQRQHLLLAVEIGGIGGGKVVTIMGTTGFIAIGLDPTDAIEAFLEDVIGARHNVVYLPHPQVTTQTGNRAIEAAMGRVQPAITHRTGGFGGGDLRRIGTTHDGDVVAFVRIIGDELRHRAVFFGDDPARGQGHIPATFGVADFGAINKGVSSPALGVALDAPGVDLLTHACHDRFERGTDLRAQCITPPHHMQGGPGQQSSDGVEVAGAHIAAEAGGFEGNRAAATKGIANHGTTPKAALAQFLHQFGQRLGLRAEVSVD